MLPSEKFANYIFLRFLIVKVISNISNNLYFVFYAFILILETAIFILEATI